jgi:hypothetical protein
LYENAPCRITLAVEADDPIPLGEGEHLGVRNAEGFNVSRRGAIEEADGKSQQPKGRSALG